MEIKMPERIDRQEWLKLLHVSDGILREPAGPEHGVHEQNPTGPGGCGDCREVDGLALRDFSRRLDRQMREAQEMLLELARPRGIYCLQPLDQIPQEGISIRKHLEGCDQAAVMAVTLGMEVDRMIRRHQVKNMAMAVILDAGASALADQAADQAEEILKGELKARLPQAFTTIRFSPGYGDYPLRYQRDIIRLTDARRKIGLTLTRGDMMVPHKSVTAIIGVADHPVTGRLATCSECLLRTGCAFLKEGTHC